MEMQIPDEPPKININYIGFGDDTPEPGIVAYVDQRAREMDDIVLKLISRHVSITLSTAEGDKEGAERATRDALEVCLDLERGMALSIISSLASTLAEHFIRDHGGADAMNERINAGAPHCCDKHAAAVGKDPDETTINVFRAHED